MPDYSGINKYPSDATKVSKKPDSKSSDGITRSFMAKKEHGNYIVKTMKEVKYPKLEKIVTPAMRKEKREKMSDEIDKKYLKA